jgi:nucleoside-diphosphate-sugar epimerase
VLALVTGATGFVGSHLADLLLARGDRVRVTVRRTSTLEWLEGKPVERVECDLREGAGLDRACEGVDVVFHVAGVVNARDEAAYRAGNWLATKRMAEAAVAAKVRRFVHVSSLAAAGPSPDGRPVTEEMECRPVSAYGRSKLEGEGEALRHRGECEVVVIRPPVVYGPRDHGLVEMYQVLRAGVKPSFGGDKYVSIVHVADLARGIALAGGHARAAGEVFHLSNEAFHSQSDVMDFILAGLERRAVRVPIPDRLVRFFGGVAEDAARMLGRHSMFNRDKAREMTQNAWVCSPAKAERLLGWRAEVEIEQGLRETLAWYRGRGIV